MHLLAKVPYASLQFTWDTALVGSFPYRTEQLRGALGRIFIEDDAVHQHDAEGKVLYRYPPIQYRWRNGHGIVAGWGEAAVRLLQLPWLDLTLRLGEDEVHIVDAVLTTNHSIFGIGDTLLRYHFVSPALILNQKNFPRYQAMSPLEQQYERDRLLVANLLIGMRGLDVEFPAQLYAAFTQTHTQSCFYKKQKLLGITGGFVSNAVLPSGFAIGHASSHGYGWIVPEDEALKGEID